MMGRNQFRVITPEVTVLLWTEHDLRKSSPWRLSKNHTPLFAPIATSAPAGSWRRICGWLRTVLGSIAAFICSLSSLCCVHLTPAHRSFPAAWIFLWVRFRPTVGSAFITFRVLCTAANLDPLLAYAPTSTCMPIASFLSVALRFASPTLRPATHH